MAGDKRELILDLLARDKTAGGTRSAAKNLGDVATAADKAGTKAEAFGRKAKDADDKAGALGGSANSTGRALDKLAGEIKTAEHELGRLGRAFANADDAAERLDISKSIRRVQNDIRRLTMAQKLVTIPEPSEEDGRSWGKKFVGALSAGVKASGDAIATAVGSKPGITIGLALGAAAAPVLVSALGSAVTAGVGGGALGAGVMLAVKKDPQIQAAGQALGKKVSDGLSASATRWFAGPIKQSIGVLDGAADGIVKRWDSAFKSLGGSVVPLTKDLVQGAENVNNALAGIAEGSGPALDTLGDSFRLLSDGAADFLTLISDDSQAAADNLLLIAGATADVVRWSGMLLKTVGDLSKNSWITGPLLPFLRKHYSDVADETDRLKGKTEAIAPPMDNAARAARGEQAALEGLAAEIKSQTDPVFGFIEAQKNLTEAQKDAADAVKKHGRNSKEAKAASLELAQAAIELESKAGKLGGTFDGKMTPALKATLRAAGLTEGQINDVAGAFRRAKRDGERFEGTYRAKVITDYISRYTTVVVGSAESAYERTKRQIGGRATGGPLVPNRPTWTGEHGPEIVQSDVPGVRVLSASASRGRIPAGAAVGAAAPRAILELRGEREIVALFRGLIRTHNLLEDR